MDIMSPSGRIRRHVLAVAAGVVMAVTATGCASQLAGLAPVSGDDVYLVRVATIDVLLAQGVSMSIVPSCEQQAQAITCAGSTVDGRPITATSPGRKGETVTIMVGGDTAYSGSVMDVVTAAARTS